MKTKPAVIWVAVASRLMVPFASNVFGAEGGLGRPISGATINPYAGLVPPSPGFAASHHFSQTDHMAFSFTFWAPTGSFETGRLVNLSLNNWTFIPGVAYTKILPQANIELSGIWQMEFYTENPATHFQNGILCDLEALAIKRKERLRHRLCRKLDPAGHGR